MAYHIYLMCMVTLLFCCHSMPVHLASSENVVYGYENEIENMIQNGGFEEDIEVAGMWGTSNGEIEYSTDAHNGNRSIRVINRTNRFGGVKQKVYGVEGSTIYYASAFIKTPNTAATSMYYKIRIWVGHQEINGGAYSRQQVGRIENQRQSGRWKQLGGDFVTPALDLEYTEIFFELTDQSIEYMVDSVSLIKIPYDAQWKQTADGEIEKHRTNIVTISGQIPSSIPYCHCEIQVNLTRRDFGFGSAIQSDRFIEDTDFGKTYRDFHFKHFNWAVLGNTMKWKPMESTQGEPKFDRVDTALDYFEAQNVTVRGHSILWGNQDNNPEFVQVLSGEDLRAEVHRRVDYLMGHYKGRIREWDVINEWLHGTYYDLTIGDPLIQEEVFSRAKAIDPDTEFFVNDYQVARSGDYASAIVDQAQELEYRGAPVSGIGIQSHLTNPQLLERLRKRIQIATASGYPVTITELNAFSFDVNERATMLDEALRVYFSTPGVRAIILWFLSDQERVSNYPEETALFEGPDFTPNAAGQVLLDRLSEWQTHLSITPSGSTLADPVRAFHGAYNVQTFYKGQSVKNQTFYLNPGVDITVTLNLSENDFPPVDPADNNC